MKKSGIFLNLIFLGLAALASLLLLSKWNQQFHVQYAEIGTIRPSPAEPNEQPANRVGGKTDQPESGGRGNEGDSTQIRQIEAAHHGLVSVEFPAKLDGAEAILKEELRFVHSLPPSRERKYLFSFLAEAYAKAAVEASPSGEDLLNRLRRFEDIIQKSAADGDVEEMLSSASMQCAKMIRDLPGNEGDALRGYLEGQGEADGAGMGARIAACCHVVDLLDSPVPDSAVIDMIDDADVRMLAERTFLRVYDFGMAPEEVVATFATRYLDDGSEIDSDHQIAIKLFGIGLRRYPEAISTVMLNAPPSQKKDEAIEQMIFRIAPGDLDRAKLWWHQIQDPEIKKRAEIDMLGRRQGANPKPLPIADPDRDPFLQ